MIGKRHLQYVILMLSIFLLLPSWGSAQLGPAPGAEDLSITFLKYPKGSDVQNPVVWEFFTEGKTEIEHYQIIGNIGNTVYKSWTSLGQKPENPSKEDRFGYISMTMNPDSLPPNSQSTLRFRACVSGLFPTDCNSRGTETKEMSWTMASGGNQEPQLEFLSLETAAGNNYEFKAGEALKISDTEISEFCVLALPADEEDIESVQLTKKDGIQLQGGPLNFPSGVSDEWCVEAGLLDESYYNHSLTVELREKGGTILEKTAYVQYVPPVHLEIKTHTATLGGLTRAQAGLERTELSTIDYEINLEASAVKGLVADYYIDNELFSSRLVQIPDNGEFVVSRADVMTKVFHYSPNDRQYESAFKIEWRGRVRFRAEDACDAEECSYEFTVVGNPTGTYEISPASGTFQTGQWYPFNVSYDVPEGENTINLKLLYTNEESAIEAPLSSKQLGSAILGISSYIDEHDLDIYLSREQVVKYLDDDNIIITPEILVLPAGSYQAYTLTTASFLISPDSEFLLDPTNQNKQRINISLAALKDQANQNNVLKEFDTSIPVGQTLQLRFQAEAARAYEFPDLDPEVEKNTDSHFEMQSLVALEPHQGSHPLIDKSFKAFPGAGLVVVNDPLTPHEMYYQAVVGPQLDSSSDNYQSTLFLSPFSVRPRSLLNVRIPNLYIKKRFIAGQGTFFNDHLAQYKEADFLNLYQILDNSGQVPTYANLKIRPLDAAEIKTLLTEVELAQEGFCKNCGNPANMTLSSFLDDIDGEQVIPVQIMDNRNVEEGDLGSSIFYTVEEMLDLSNVVFQNYVNTNPIPLLPRDKDTPFPTIQALPLSNSSFSLTSGGAIAFGLATGDDSSIACGQDGAHNCARAFVSAQMLVDEYAVKLAPFMIYFTVDPGLPSATPSYIGLE